MKLDRWVVHGDCLVGYLYDSLQFKSGTRVVTEAVRFIDPLNMEAECLDGRYKLGEPGTASEHNQPLVGKKPSAELPVINKTIFLNPKG